MGISITEQGLLFLFSCAVGVFLGLVYDVFRIWRIAFKSRWCFIFIQDFLYCMFAALSVMILIYYANSGQVRWFSLFGCFISFILYYITVGKLIMFVAEKIINLIKRILNFIYSITVKPVIRLIKYLFNFIKRRFNKMLSAADYIVKRITYVKSKNKIKKEAKKGFNL